MESLVGFRQAILSVRPSSLCHTKRSNFLVVKANLLDHDDDPLFQSAIKRASLRLQETRRPDPLFIDPYVGCLLPANTELSSKPQLNSYCLATKYIDDKLLTSINDIDDLKQVVLLTDGIDTRPYRLNWPRSTMIFDISPERIFEIVTQTLKDVGTKVPKGCLFRHVPSESSSIQQTLCSKGFKDARSSIWVLQGFPIKNMACFKEILLLVGNLAMKDDLFIGELPSWLVDSDWEVKRWMENIFLTNGFQVKLIQYNEIGENLDRELAATEDYNNILFVAKHLRYSDAQVDIWRREFQRIEEEGNEDGFDEL